MPCSAAFGASRRTYAVFSQGTIDPAIIPASTCSGAAVQARAALRRWRDALSSGALDDQAGPLRLTIRLPLPCPSRRDDALSNFDEGEWPGGVQQRFRSLRPLIEEHLLAGYEPEFLGMLESPADGMGVWRAAGGSTTVVAQVSNPTFAPFARLCAGEFGSAVSDPGHTLICVNPSWTSSRDIGQLWDRQLKQQAAALIDDAGAWLALYHLWDVRTAKGATGLLFKAWPHDWQLYDTSRAGEPAEALGSAPVLVSPERPSVEEQIRLLNAALADQQARSRQERKK